MRQDDHSDAMQLSASVPLPTSMHSLDPDVTLIRVEGLDFRTRMVPAAIVNPSDRCSALCAMARGAASDR